MIMSGSREYKAEKWRAVTERFESKSVPCSKSTETAVGLGDDCHNVPGRPHPGRFPYNGFTMSRSHPDTPPANGGRRKGDWLQHQNELILNAAGEGIYGLDADGMTVFINPAATRMTGFTVADSAGVPIHDLHHHTKADGSPYPKEECPIFAALSDGTVHSGDDEVFWHKDGTSFPVEYTSTPIYEGGEVVGAVVVFRDITERKDAETALRNAFDELARMKERLQEQNVYLREEIRTDHNFEEIVGEHPALKQSLQQVRQVAPTEAAVLIQGETGTGKELFARAIHDMSPRADQPFVKINCGAIPDGLVESELFGHEKGAFTGALAQRRGRFELADRGTIFLDEVGELPQAAQVKLLRVLQEREFERVGGSRSVRVDVRVIAATNRNLVQMVDEGGFRRDLFYRLNVFPIRVPPLRERASDIPLLAGLFVRQAAARMGKRLEGVMPQCQQHLMRYGWPGNVRELQNVIERAVITSEGPLVVIAESLTAEPVSAAPVGELPTLEQVERDHIRAALARTSGVISGPKGAARILGLHPNTLRSRMAKLGIRRGD